MIVIEDSEVTADNRTLLNLTGRQALCPSGYIEQQVRDFSYHSTLHLFYVALITLPVSVPVGNVISVGNKQKGSLGVGDQRHCSCWLHPCHLLPSSVHIPCEPVSGLLLLVGCGAVWVSHIDSCILNEWTAARPSLSCITGGSQCWQKSTPFVHLARTSIWSSFYITLQLFFLFYGGW